MVRTFWSVRPRFLTLSDMRIPRIVVDTQSCLGIAEADGKKSSAILTLKPHVDKPLWKILLAAAAFLPPWDIEQKYGTMDPTLTAAT